MLEDITPLILTLNEAPNIGRTLDRLTWARDIVVVDSGSSDATREILAGYRNVRVFERPFTSHSEQWNYGLEETGIGTDWVLALDADYLLPEELVRELSELKPESDLAGYHATFRYCIDGRPLRGTALPPVTVLYRRKAAFYEQDGHTQRVRVRGHIAALKAPIHHDDRKPLAQWLAAQARYMKLEAEKLSAMPLRELNLADRLRRLIVAAPGVMFLYCYFICGGILDGRAGLFYALQRMTAEMILSLYLLQRAFDSMKVRR